jgi:hypothetical protein
MTPDPELLEAEPDDPALAQPAPEADLSGELIA